MALASCDTIAPDEQVTERAARLRPGHRGLFCTMHFCQQPSRS